MLADGSLLTNGERGIVTGHSRAHFNLAGPTASRIDTSP
jgi:hypothetical protein